jgi:hypothetical protein
MGQSPPNRAHHGTKPFRSSRRPGPLTQLNDLAGPLVSKDFQVRLRSDPRRSRDVFESDRSFQ